MLPLSTSSRDAVRYFKFSRLERKIEKTDAASVELIKEPIKKLSANSILSAKKQNRPVRPAVKTTPAVDSKTARPTTGFAALHFVPYPP